MGLYRATFKNVCSVFLTRSLIGRFDFIILFFFSLFSFSYGITTLGFSADGDIRLLKSMRYKTPSISHLTTDEDLLFQSPQVVLPYYCIQDIMHIVAKHRNRILKSGVVLPMGKKIVSLSHLKILINNFSKDWHGLVLSDVCPDDRQNIQSIEKIMNVKVLKALSDFIVDSEATVMYLKIGKNVFNAFYDDALSPKERIYLMFHACYFFRAWKMWIENSGNIFSEYN